MADAFATNDQEDSQRMWRVFQGLAGSALGIDQGAADSALPLTNPVGQFQVLNVTTGTATQGQAATATVTVAGKSITLPALALIVAAAWFFLKR